MKSTSTPRILILAIGILSMALASPCIANEPTPSKAVAETGAASAHNAVVHDTIEIDGVEIFYREAGPKDAPTLFLLHGYPTSSHMFRNLMRDLADKYHTLARIFHEG